MRMAQHHDPALDAPWRTSDPILVGVLYGIAAVATGFVLALLRVRVFGPSEALSALEVVQPTLQLVNSVLLAAVTVGWLMQRYPQEWTRIWGKRRLTPRTCILALAAGLAAFLLEGPGARRLSTELLSDSIPLTAVQGEALLVWFDALTAIVMAPVAEEMFFRGLLFQAFARRWNGVSAAMLSSVVFSLVHVRNLETQSLLIGAGVFVSGLVFAKLFWKSGTLWAPIVGHMTVNAAWTLWPHVM